LTRSLRNDWDRGREMELSLWVKRRAACVKIMGRRLLRMAMVKKQDKGLTE
jgi:hypothetical protein